MKKIAVVTFSDEVLAATNRRAAALGMSRSAYLRKVIEDHIRDFPLKEFLEKTEFVGVWKKKPKFKSIGDVTEARQKEGLHGS